MSRIHPLSVEIWRWHHTMNDDIKRLDWMNWVKENGITLTKRDKQTNKQKNNNAIRNNGLKKWTDFSCWIGRENKTCNYNEDRFSILLSRKQSCIYNEDNLNKSKTNIKIRFVNKKRRRKRKRERKINLHY